MTLTHENVKEIDRIYMRNGNGKDVVAKVAKQYGITEAFAGGIAQALKEKRGPNIPDIVTESSDAFGSAPPTATDNVHKQHLASVLVAQVNAAEAKIEADGGSLADLSIQQLEALAARFG